MGRSGHPLWIVTFVLLLISVVGMFSIGMLVFPAAVLLVIAAILLTIQ